jgi:hypothetical protein
LKITQAISKSGINSVDAAFDDFFKTLRPSLKLWDYFVNWDKVYRNTKEIEIYLNLWNFLLGKENFDEDFEALLGKHPEIVKAIPSLIVRDGNTSQAFSIIEDISDLGKPDLFFDFSTGAKTKEQRESALKFIKSSGLIRLFKKDGVKNLVDYVIGVEAGLDSNGRKNRSGTSMEGLVDAYLAKFTKSAKLEYISQATPNKIKEKWGFVVPVDKSSRSFDFAISDGKTLVLMEVNFYGGGGSKLKATAGEYKGLNVLLKIPKVKFVWVTDGLGWNTTKLPLRSAYEEIDYLWNLDWLNRGYLAGLF